MSPKDDGNSTVIPDTGIRDVYHYTRFKGY